MLATLGILLFGAPLLLGAAMIWLYDLGFPLYVSVRIGRKGQPFRMYKLRSMSPNAERGASSSGADDNRITPVGRVVRKLKLDEAAQFLNVVRGDMSLVGPRPQVAWAVAEYTDVERQMLTVSPGLTDPASIVFSDQDELLRGAADPDLRYSRMIRPWKSRLALLYVQQGAFGSYLVMILATLLSVGSRKLALRLVTWQLKRWKAGADVLSIAQRTTLPPEAPPPGAARVVDRIRVSGGSAQAQPD